jgi:hypothetical protein
VGFFGIDITDKAQAALMSVEPVDPAQGAVNLPRAYSTVYVRGNFSGGVDGSGYKVMGCVETGTYQYTNVMGGLSTVWAFASNHLILLRGHDEPGNVIETHEHKGDFKEW